MRNTLIIIVLLFSFACSEDQGDQLNQMVQDSIIVDTVLALPVLKYTESLHPEDI